MAAERSLKQVLLLFVCSGLIADRPVFCICATGRCTISRSILQNKYRQKGMWRGLVSS